MRIVLSETLSYCVGVRNTLELAERLLAENPGRRYYMLGEIVHNERVVEGLRDKGLRIVQTLDEVPPGGVVILQSHGSPRRRYRELEERGLEYVDATCPMVRLIHDKARAFEADGRTLVVIGQVGHEEIQGIVGQVGRAIVVRDPEEVTPERFRGIERAGVVVQSTFIEAEARRVLARVREVVPDVAFHDTVCRPTKTRQREVEVHTRTADCVVVVGSRRSANTMHLFRLARAINPCTYLVDDPVSVDGVAIPEGATVFIASGASTPMDLIAEVVRRLEARAGRGAEPGSCAAAVGPGEGTGPGADGKGGPR